MLATYIQWMSYQQEHLEYEKTFLHLWSEPLSACMEMETKFYE